MVVEFTTTCGIVAYHHLSCEVKLHSWRGVLDTTVCDKVCQWLDKTVCDKVCQWLDKTVSDKVCQWLDKTVCDKVCQWLDKTVCDKVCQWLDKTVCDKVGQWLDKTVCDKVTCDRSVDFSRYSNFRHKSSNWNIFESDVN